MHKFASGLNKNISIKYVWNKIKVIKKGWNKVEWNKWQIKDRKQEIEKTIKKLAPPWVSSERENKNTMNRIEEKVEELNKNFTVSELNRAIKYTKNTSAPGSDGIEYNMLKRLPGKYRKELLAIMNDCFRESKMTIEWKENITVFIDKGNREKVRPITMSSCVSKVMERMINERLMWWAERAGILEEWQNGFRRGRSCLDNLAKVRMEAEIAARTGEQMILTFLDVNGTYDSVLKKY